MSYCHRRRCCRPCCQPTLIPIRTRIPRALVLGVLLALLLNNNNTGPTENTNIINVNSENVEDIYDEECDCECDSHCKC